MGLILLDFLQMRSGTILILMPSENAMPGSIILNNRYHLEERVGSGGMAVVYRARDLELERLVAIKVLREDYSSDEAFRERFRQEARAAANLSHPNIVTVHDFGLHAGRLFIVMEHVPGTDLKTTLQHRRGFSVEETLSLMVQACAGVGYAHRAGLVHCDIKPQNMLITPDHRLKVVDFGIARALASIQPDEKAEIVWGSPQYFSPEQAAGEPPSPASDVYSLGIVMYEMLTGQLPFSASSSTELARRHRQDMPKAPREINPAIPPNLELILLKVLAKEPSARYRTADQLGRVLTNFMQHPDLAKTVTSQPAPFTPSERSESPTTPNPASRPILLELERQEKNPLDIDWITIALGLLALIAVGGLVPFFLWVYFAFNPPIP
jgi:eukaryotic-like serine/threonine-protein kinase